MGKLKGWKTILFNIIMIGFALVAVLNPEAVLPGEAAVKENIQALETVVVFFWGVGNVILRAVTNSPIFKK